MLIKQGQNIQQVLESNPAESQFELEAGVYNGPVNFSSISSNKHLFNNAGNPDAVSIISKAGPSCIGISANSSHISLVNLTFKNNNQLGSIIDIYGSDVKIENCKLLGSPINGQHRGIAANGASISIVRTRIEDCFLVGRDAQAICGWTGTENLLIDNCYLEGGAQSVMFGGADPENIFRIPTNIKIINSVLTKKLEWYSMSSVPQMKCALELKNCKNFYCFNNTLEYAGTAQGQGSFIIVLTPRNQSGKASYSTVQNALIEHCVCRFGGGCVNFLGGDTNWPSGPLRNITIADTEFSEINHVLWKGSGRIFQFIKAPQNIVLQDLSIRGIDGQQLNSNAYFIGEPPTNLVMKNIKWPTTKYGMKIDDGGSGLDAVKKYCPSLVYEGVEYV